MPGSSAYRRVVAPTGSMNRWSVLATMIGVVSGGLVAAALVLQALHRTSPPSVAFWLSDVLSAVVYAAATVVMLPRVRHAVVWIMAATAIGSAIAGFATQYYLFAVDRGGAVGADLVVLTGGWVWLPGSLATVAILPWIVLPRPVPWWARCIVGLAVAAISLAVIRLLTLDYRDIANPAAVDDPRLQAMLRDLGLWPDRVCVVIAFGGVLWLAHAWRTAEGDDARGLGWLVLGQLFLSVALVPVVFVDMTQAAVEATGVLVILAQAFLPVALLVVVLRQRLWGIDVTVSRVTVWWLLTVALLVAYAVLAWLCARLLPEAQGLAGLVSVGAVVVLGQPARFWIQQRVDRLIYGWGADPARLLGTLGRDQRSTGTRSNLDGLVDALRDGLRLGGVEVRSADSELRARSGLVETEELTVSLAVEGRRVGDLVVAAPTGQRIDPRTRRLVEQTSDVIAVALELAEVNAQLASAGDRITEVRQEERRMLRRDLHDGMGPALAGVGLGLAAAQRRLVRDPEGTAKLLADLEVEVERRTEDLRLMARALLPAQLDDGDLERALSVLADRFRASGLEVDVAYKLVEPLTTRYQIAVYHVAAEALMNAYRHARASRVLIVVRPAGAGVDLEVDDDGQGLRDDPDAGVGLRSMRERAGELAGELSLSARPDGPGTRVRMVLP